VEFVTVEHIAEIFARTNEIFIEIHISCGVVRAWWTVTEGVEEFAGSIFMVTHRLEYTSTLP
jgi:hypothetical protein